MLKKMETPRPILKWAGGKTSLLSQFEELGLIPDTFNRYYEPFFGAGALFFHLYRNNKIKKATISDVNQDLCNLYSLIKYDSKKFTKYVSELELSISSVDYYVNRNEFNRLKKKNLCEIDENDRYKRAALLLYLNRTCYSGIYRENMSGDFNVPYGNYKNPKIFDDDNLEAMGESLKDVSVFGKDFEKVVCYARKDDFIYFDPPYMKCDAVSGFVDYHKTRFYDESQKRLCDVFKKLNEKGCKLMLSNSSSEKLNNMYMDIENINIMSVLAPRLINRKREGMVFVKEYVITNYEVMHND